MEKHQINGLKKMTEDEVDEESSEDNGPVITRFLV